ncbi:hypothetical protein [Vibrio sp. CK2-1]|uniref:hypothetical protein n=1 Tax=Vibrio sp. CK2-1 TaxID=2912249 RepID=UPI001F31DDB1|nr:hypothetical protein [Vibrio sp. CK2-1]MCF7354900.1 hypothetical protein [Vibrio sp. CK2-1]
MSIVEMHTINGLINLFLNSKVLDNVSYWDDFSTDNCMIGRKFYELFVQERINRDDYSKFNKYCYWLLETDLVEIGRTDVIEDAFVYMENLQ